MASSSSSFRHQIRRREQWLVLLGIGLHAIYMLSIFDIYFKSPIVHGMDPISPNLSSAPASRLVLIVADGLRADKFFAPSPSSSSSFLNPFLRSVILDRGRWGVSHARPPTESRPGHVAIIAGFYEDPSAVTKGWKANPVEFDSVFKRSRFTVSFGSPDIVPIFCSDVEHSLWGSYPHEFEDFATGMMFESHLGLLHQGWGCILGFWGMVYEEQYMVTKRWKGNQVEFGSDFDWSIYCLLHHMG